MAFFARLLGRLVLDCQVRADRVFFSKLAFTSFRFQITAVIGIEHSYRNGVGGVGFEVPIIEVCSTRDRSFFMRLPLISTLSSDDFNLIKWVVILIPIT